MKFSQKNWWHESAGKVPAMCGNEPSFSCNGAKKYFSQKI